VLLGPIVAMLSFVCSVGNIPLAAVLWSGGITFAGVLAFIFADLIVLSIIAIYRKYYGTQFALRITVLMFVTMVVSALVVDALFGGLGLIPNARPTRADIFGSVKVDYKLVTNILGLIAFATLFGLTMRRGAPDPMCGMRVARGKASRWSSPVRPTTSAPPTASTRSKSIRDVWRTRRPANTGTPTQARATTITEGTA
jgi:uncharacterized membrane protein YraQ (UPF0718 family)